MNIEQIDRDAAGDLWAYLFPHMDATVPEIRNGAADNFEIVQTLARHRIAGMLAAAEIAEGAVQPTGLSGALVGTSRQAATAIRQAAGEG